MPSLPQPDIVETDPTSSFTCDYVAGVNRVLSLPPYLVVDNIARNVEVWRMADGVSRPLTRARYDHTSYPGDPDASLLDVDVHAALLVNGDNGGRALLLVNHFGRVRRFALPAEGERLRATTDVELLGDMERVVLVDGCFVGTSPRGEFTDDPAHPGLVLFERIARWPDSVSGRAPRLAAEFVLAEWGVVTALAVSAPGALVAVAAGQRVGVFELVPGAARLRLGACRWESTVPCHIQWLCFGHGGLLSAAGHRPSPDSWTGDPDVCRGGSLYAWAADTGVLHGSVPLPEETSWGYGADPIVPDATGRSVYVLGRDGSLWGIDVAGRSARRIYRPINDDAARASLGIGHATLRDGWIYAGFSRGGFRLRRYALPAT